MLKTVYRIVTLTGWNPRAIGQLRQLPRFVGDYRRFRRAGGKVSALFPVLSDYTDTSGAASGHYFHQDLIVAQAIHDAAPERHLDVGSRIDGFVAHVAAFRTIDVLDIRPLPNESHPNIRFVQADLMRPQPHLEAAYPSVSCLHALEHFGLGRYGDSIDPNGHRAGFAAVAALVRPGGTLYVSVPIGRPIVAFNAHRIFDPNDPVGWAGEMFDLVRFDLVDDEGKLRRDVTPDAGRDLEYGCGIYTFRRRA